MKQACIVALALFANLSEAHAEAEPLLLVVEGGRGSAASLRDSLASELGSPILSLSDRGADRAGRRLFITVENQRATLLFEASFGPRLLRFVGLRSGRPLAEQLREAVAALIVEVKSTRHGPVEVLDPFGDGGARVALAASEVLDPFPDLAPAMHAGLAVEVLDPFRRAASEPMVGDRTPLDPWHPAPECADALGTPTPSR